MEDASQRGAGSSASYLPERIRVCVCAADEDLRAWIVEELRLMTWIGELDLGTVSTVTAEGFDPATLDLVIVGSDHLTPADNEALANRAWKTPVIAVGETRVDGDRSFGSRLTSRELKQAIRELVFVRR